MIKGGADLTVTRSALSTSANHGLLFHIHDFDEDLCGNTASGESEAGMCRWTGLENANSLAEENEGFTVREVLESFKPVFGYAVNSLQDFLLHRERVNNHVAVRPMRP